MSHLSRIFSEAPVKVQNKNGFDLSHLNCGTAKCGQLVPVLCKLLPPNTDFTLGVNMTVELPPLVAPVMGRIDAIVEGFVVPCSILYGGWRQFISNNPATAFPELGEDVTPLNISGSQIPYFKFPGISLNHLDFTLLYDDNNNIAEYLGIRNVISSSPSHIAISLLPFVAYHLIWDVFYRNKQVTKSIFIPAAGSFYGELSPVTSAKQVGRIPNAIYFGHDGLYLGGKSGDISLPGSHFYQNSDFYFPDGVSVFSTRQRNYARDYFTAATLSPQQGNASRLIFDVDVANADGAFTIGALRAANSLQKFLETNNLSQDYSDMMRNRWGVRPKDADFEEPYYLGRVVLPVYSKGIYQNQSTSTPNTGGNPFASQGVLGAKGGSAAFAGEGSICDKYRATTWSYVMCLFSLVPHAMYGTGINRELTIRKIGDFPAPEMQTVGHEAIYSYELNMTSVTTVPLTFGYIPRYSRFKYMDDEIHGELRPGKSLDSFVLQRRLGADAISLTTAFLEIPQDALDDIFAVSTESMNLSCWYEIFFAFKVSMPLADFCIPTLGELEDTHTIKSTVGGSRL